MRLNFCTLFDSNYLSRGMAMLESLRRTGADFHLYIFAFDEVADSYLRNRGLPDATVISLAEFEDPELLSVKPARSIAEYCWTSTPSTILYCLDHFKLDHCTYIDADLFFFSDPSPLVEEMGDRSVLLTEHRFSLPYRRAVRNGIYCVQFMTFKNTPDGRRALEWWRGACLDWCYARLEDGKFGDQKYLDDWPERFSGIHVLENEGGGLAPWNIVSYDILDSAEGLLCKNKKTKRESRVVFYHFHFLRYYKDGLVDTGDYWLPENAKAKIYAPYIRELERTKHTVQQQLPGPDPHGPRREPETLRYRLRKMVGYNLKGVDAWMAE